MVAIYFNLCDELRTAALSNLPACHITPITVIMQQRESGKDIEVSGDRAKVCEPYDSPF